jgi:hypothetical protein
MQRPKLPAGFQDVSARNMQIKLQLHLCDHKQETKTPWHANSDDQLPALRVWLSIHLRPRSLFRCSQFLRNHLDLVLQVRRSSLPQITSGGQRPNPLPWDRVSSTERGSFSDQRALTAMHAQSHTHIPSGFCGTSPADFPGAGSGCQAHHAPSLTLYRRIPSVRPKLP